MLKISRQGCSVPGVTLLLEGALRGPWVMELRTTCEQILTEHGRLTLDLADVVFIDGDGAALLASLHTDNRIKIAETSLFVDEILRKVTS